MKIKISPSKRLPNKTETTISVSGDTITIDDTPYDLSAIPEGGEAIPEGDDHPFIGTITRENGEIICSVITFLGDDTEPNQPTDPEHWIVTTTDDGPVEIPAIRKPKSTEIIE